MKIISTLFFCIVLLSCSNKEETQTTEASTYLSEIAERISAKSFDPSTLMWYTKPASAWEDALPVGNGRIGAMVFGGIEEERIQLNEETYWSGGPYSTVVKGGYKALPKIQ
jgi:alpha-L-fucosidase 2